MQGVSRSMAPITISLDNLIGSYETFLFDADGVLWTGDCPVAGAVELINRLTTEKKDVFILTNNSTKTHEMYVSKLKKIGFDAVPPQNVISPAIVLADFIRNTESYRGKEVFLLGTKNLQSTLENVGIKVIFLFYLKLFDFYSALVSVRIT